MSKKEDLLGLGALGILVVPHFAIILLVLALVLIGVFLGLITVVYVTLQNYHLLTAVSFLTATLIMFYVALKSEIVTKKTVKQYPWMWMLIPASFIFGYIAEGIQLLEFTVAPLQIASEQQGATNFVILLVLIFGVLAVLRSLSEKK